MTWTTHKCTAQVAAAAVLLLAAAGCSSEPEPPPPPPAYRIMVTEPSGNIDTATEHLWAHWSCDPTVNPATRYRGTQDHLWTSLEGTPGQAVLLTHATCPPGALLTVHVDAAAKAPSFSPTRLRCEVFAPDGSRVADESVTRGFGSSDPVCRVLVP